MVARPAAQSGLGATGPGMASELRRLASAEDVLGGTTIPADVRSTLQLRRGGGSALPEGVSSAVGRRLGQDLSGVRVHADGEADRLARSDAVGGVHPGLRASTSRVVRTRRRRRRAVGCWRTSWAMSPNAPPARPRPSVGRTIRSRRPRTARQLESRPTSSDWRAVMRRPNGRSSAALDDGESGPVRRKISKTSRDIDELRSEAGQEKGKRTSDSLHRIGLLLERLGRWGRT